MKFQISDISSGEVEVVVYHEGSDGIQLDFIELTTSARVLTCPINKKLDGTDYFASKCR